MNDEPLIEYIVFDEGYTSIHYILVDGIVWYMSPGDDGEAFSEYDPVRFKYREHEFDCALSKLVNGHRIFTKRVLTKEAVGYYIEGGYEAVLDRIAREVIDGL